MLSREEPAAERVDGGTANGSIHSLATPLVPRCFSVQVPLCGIIRVQSMRASKPIAIVTLILTLGFMVPMLCFAFVADGVATGTTSAPGGCHGHHGPMPQPAHACCYAAHQVPAATPIAPSPAALDSTIRWIAGFENSDGLNSGWATIESNDSSPPPPAILRI